MGTLSDITAELGDLEETERTERESIALAKEQGDEPLRGIRLNGLAWVVLQRGRVDEAEELRRQSRAILEANREPQADVFVFATEAAIALARGREVEALEHLRRGAEMARGFTLDQVPLLFYELVRLLLRTDDRTGADGYRDLSSPGRAPATNAFAVAIEGLLEEDAVRAAELLRDAAGEFARLVMRIAQARVLVDLGEALIRAARIRGRRSSGRATCSSRATPGSTSPRSRRRSRAPPSSGSAHRAGRASCRLVSARPARGGGSLRRPP